MIKKCIHSLFDTIGFELKKKDDYLFLGYELEKEADDLIRKVRSYTMLSRRRLITLYQQVVFCERNNIPGCFVECGVWKGGAVALMALANMKNTPNRRIIHLFDAFKDICEPDASVDGERAIAEARRWSKGGLNGKLEPLDGIYNSIGGPGTLIENRDLLENIVKYDADYLHYHEGWFQESLPRDVDCIGEIAILRLDGDWYASTKICLDYLCDKVVPGGFVIIDDYGAYDGCKQAVDDFLKQKAINAYLNHIDEVGRYWIKP